MAEPRRISTRRAVLSYEHLKQLTKLGGFEWPDLLIKDYQGILQDSSFLADEIDNLELRVIQNEEDILDLQQRVTALEYRVFETLTITENFLTEEFQIIICENTTPINVTLKESPQLGDEVHIRRGDAEVTVIGEINGLTNVTINVINYSLHLVFNGTDWSEI